MRPDRLDRIASRRRPSTSGKRNEASITSRFPHHKRMAEPTSGSLVMTTAILRLIGYTGRQQTACAVVPEFCNDPMSERSLAPPYYRGTRHPRADQPRALRTGLSCPTRQTAAVRGRWRQLYRRGSCAWAPLQRCRSRPGGALQPRRPAGSGPTPRRWPAHSVHRQRARAHSLRVPSHPRPRTRWHSHLVAHDSATRLAQRARRLAAHQHLYNLVGLARRWLHRAGEAIMGSDRHGDTQAQRRSDRRHRPRYHGKKNLIEDAYLLGEALGLSVWTQDEAGPFQTTPYEG